MTFAAPNLHKPLRRDAPVVCAKCGRRIPRQAKQQRYCGRRCRKRANYAKTAVQPLQNEPRYPTSGVPTNPHKKANGFNALQGQKTGSRVAQTLRRAVLELEVFGGRQWREVVS